jgi:hypothetical protein
LTEDFDLVEEEVFGRSPPDHWTHRLEYWTAARFVVTLGFLTVWPSSHGTA